jgi:hypothetical protein
MEISQDHYKVLQHASTSFLTSHDFGAKDIEDAMNSTFGEYSKRTGPQAQAWVQYWKLLELWDEKKSSPPPSVRGI